jgi:hypothetical protein
MYVYKGMRYVGIHSFYRQQKVMLIVTGLVVSRSEVSSYPKRATQFQSLKKCSVNGMYINEIMV